jgi:hypothetical protein
MGADALSAAAGGNGVQCAVRKQENESDFDFLGRVAAENGWEMTIDHTGPTGGHTLRFFSPLGKLTPDLTLAYGESLVEFSPRVTSVGQIVSVSAIIWISSIKTRFQVTVGWDWDRASLTIKIMPVVAFMGVGSDSITFDEPLTPSTAPRKILSTLIPKLNQRLTGSGSTVGNLEIKPGGVIQFLGLGEDFGGYYRVTEVTHTLDGSGFNTRFEVRKEIWFAGIPLPEQGAIPVRVTV